ncbi:MAG: hypothetical protein P4L40_08090, partial [Terracidiphilus sp.]|nr:hypothetical protein [Terracidiphilus sp.]
MPLTLAALAQNEPNYSSCASLRPHPASRTSFLLVLLPLLFLGCKSAPAPAPTPSTETTSAATYAPRPTTPPAPFKIFHHANSTFTL